MNMLRSSRFRSVFSPRLPFSDRSCVFIRTTKSAFSDRSSSVLIRTIKSVVWWDLQCSVPEDYLCTVYNRIGSALETRGMESPIWVDAYASFSNVKISAQQALNSSGVRLIHVPDCETTSSLLRKQIMTWCTYNSPPAHVVLISNDNSLASMVEDLTRLKYVVIVSCDTHLKRHLLCKASTFVWPWQPLAKGLDFDVMQFSEIPDMMYRIHDANRKALNHIKSLSKSIYEPKRCAKKKAARIHCQVLSITDSPRSSPVSIGETKMEALVPTGKIIDEALVPTGKTIDETKMEALVPTGEIKYCRTIEEIDIALTDLHETLSKAGVQHLHLGFEMEWKPYGRGEASNQTAVVQIQVDEEFCTCCYVLQIVKTGIPLTLKSLLENKNYLKVGMSILTDVAKLEKDHGILVQPVMDIGQFAATKFPKPQTKKWGLSTLTALVLEKKLVKPKEISTSNWEVDTLSEEQILYAAKDAYASLHVYKALTHFPNFHEEQS